jgi:hypothetical protein
MSHKTMVHAISNAIIPIGMPRVQSVRCSI